MRSGADNDDNLETFGNYLTFWKNTKMSDKFLLFFFDPKYRHHRHQLNLHAVVKQRIVVDMLLTGMVTRCLQ